MNHFQESNLLHKIEVLALFNSGFSSYLRYFCIGGGFLLIYAIHVNLKETFIQPTILNLKVSFDLILHIYVFAILSYELKYYFFKFKGNPESGNLSLSILWGIYALALIILGIAKRQKHLRIMAITLFSITLIKLFLIDITRFDTIGKTIVFVSLGILLLIISFLYNKYKTYLLDEPAAK